MKQKGLLIGLIVVLIFNVSDAQSLQNTTISSLGPVSGDQSPLVRRIFAKHISVFGVDIFATASTRDTKVRHAATVLADYLDDNADGIPNDVAVIQALQRQKAAMVMFFDEAEFERVLEQLENAGDEPQNWQPLFDRETHPNGAAVGMFDVALEEVLHLVSHAGYATIYPGTLGEQPGSQLTNAMDRARGGRFFNVPSRYPPGAWYTYDDRTCEYECQATEYFYWALTSLLGGQAFPGRLDEIENEWRLNTPEKLRQGDPLMYALLTDPSYNLPTVLPDGVYP